MSANAKLDGLVGSLDKLERLGDAADKVTQLLNREADTSVRAVEGAQALATRLAEVNKRLSPFLATQTNEGASGGQGGSADPVVAAPGNPVLSAAERAAATSAERNK